MNRKHTKRFNPAEALTKAFDRYRDGAMILRRNIQDMRFGALAQADAQRKLFEIFHRQLLPSRMLVPVADSFFSGQDQTDWGLLNACTLHAKNLPPNSNIRAHAQLGRYFGLGKVDPYVC
jgi:hypothetical protein